MTKPADTKHAQYTHCKHSALPARAHQIIGPGAPVPQPVPHGRQLHNHVHTYVQCSAVCTYARAHIELWSSTSTYVRTCYDCSTGAPLHYLTPLTFSSSTKSPLSMEFHLWSSTQWRTAPPQIPLCGVELGWSGAGL